MTNILKRHQPVIDALRAGKSRAEVAEDSGYCYGLVCQIARAAGIARQIKNHSHPESATKRRRRIVLETLANYTIRETADRLRLPYTTVYGITKRNGVEKPPAYQYREANQSVVADARAKGLTAAARLHGISRERVRQIVAKHEAATGDHIERGRRDQEVYPTGWPQTILCGECRHPITINNGRALERHSGLCVMCSIRQQKGSRFTHAAIEAVIAERLAGGRKWLPIALQDFGLRHESAHTLTRSAFTQLRRSGRRNEIDRLWPKGVPHWLQKYDVAA